MSKKTKQAVAPIESIVPLLDPVRVYTAKELAVMPLSKMNAAIEAQEQYYLLEHATQMGGASYFHSSTDARWGKSYPGQRKISHTIQNQQRIYRTSNYSPVGKARFSEIRWGE